MFSSVAGCVCERMEVDKGARGAGAFCPGGREISKKLWSSEPRVTTFAPHGWATDGTVISYRVGHLYGRRSNEVSVFVTSGGKKSTSKKERSGAARMRTSWLLIREPLSPRRRHTSGHTSALHRACHVTDVLETCTVAVCVAHVSYGRTCCGRTDIFRGGVSA